MLENVVTRLGRQCSLLPISAPGGKMRYASEIWSSPSRHKEQAASFLTLGSRAVASILPLLLLGCSLGPAVVARERTGAVPPSVSEGTSVADPQRIPAGPLPLVDYHRHLMSPAARIASESFVGGGPPAPEPVTAEQLVSWLAEAGIQRALVLSLAYWFGSPYGAPVADEYAKVRAENDWTADQAKRFPDQLVAFCSFNPLKDYALEELERCAANPHLNGLKLHFANSQVDVFDPEHVEKLRRVFGTANRHGLPMVVHLWVPGGTYGRRHAEVLLERILPEAPDVVVQVAHFAGGGPGYTDEALAVYADAIAAGDARTRNLYFDIASVPEGLRTRTELFLFAERIRQVGLERVLFGSDMVPPPALEPWSRFRSRVPLTETEFRAIADNIAPYLR